jgi:AcrR family transcriptional regulator
MQDEQVQVARNRPKQSRGVETFNSIVEASAVLFGEQDYEQTTTHQIAAQAGISVGALYRYFSDKEAILIELYRREISGLRNRILEEFTKAEFDVKDPRGAVRQTLATAIRVYGEHAKLRRVLSEQSRKIPALAELRKSQEAEVHAIVQQILNSVSRTSLRDVEVSAYLLTHFFERLIDERTLYRETAADFDDQRVIDAAADFVLRSVYGSDVE